MGVLEASGTGGLLPHSLDLLLTDAACKSLTRPALLCLIYLRI